MIRYSRHASERMIERGISSNEVEDAIRKGSTEMQGSKMLHHYRHFTAVTIRINKDTFVITVMLRC